MSASVGNGVESPARLHDRPDQRLARLAIVLERQHVADHAAVRAVAAPDLLAARPGRLAGGALAPRQPGIFLQLVGAVERRRVLGGDEARADAVAADRGAGAHQRRELVLVQAAADEDVHIREPAVVENPPHRPGERGEIAAVDAHGAHRDAVGLELRRQRDHLAGRRLGVVGVDQQGQVLAPRAGEVLERRRSRRRAPR